ncbi:MAG TPA: bifunctional phosphoribosylaminoimidazolecarboxamide formyltransferase/IMP cyclohydrolase, partial [Armatimonadetes bacterium]|nr:bifunctional phosphoribosylaminoimidazolecarboxamide formyltransferase/IMP cyclohydrolase [Armatimonadota bacterium]
MAGKVRVRTALLSAYEKAGLEEVAGALRKFGCRILASGGTQKFLKERGFEVESLERFTGFSELLGGRVKTLHPSVHAMILARASDLSELEREGLPAVDLVLVNLYPFEGALSGGRADVELIDIGGVALIRAGAKNFERVAVVCEPHQYRELVEELERNDGCTTLEFRRRMAAYAFRRTALYDTAIASWLDGERMGGVLALSGRRALELRYGENPHQRGALYAPADPTAYGIHLAEKLQGKELSYNNLLDAWSAWLLVNEFEEPAAVVIKHTNPCGAAVSEELWEAYVKAREADPVSAFGGIVGLNREVDKETAKRIVETFIEVVVAPSYEEGALEVLATKPEMRVLRMPPLPKEGWVEVRALGASLLAQEPDFEVWRREELKVVTRREPTEEEWRDLDFAWKVVKHVKSNAIVVAKGRVTLGIGAGQMSRVEALRIALEGAGEGSKGAVVASDAFFPFRDSIDLA